MKVLPGEASPASGKTVPPQGGSEVVGIDGKGRLIAHKDGEAARFKLYVMQDGTLRAAKHVEEKTENSVDQIGRRETVPVAARWADVDQA